ncbi:PREDICTED: lysyl oxidase homolog 3 isoform X3 [Mandrillus leucophaeus]|uniref:Lysyl oxidase homolog n=3 Tax=Cercopithecinae TaxID=9528 RepID=A0A2K5KI93_CERAT|nr:PREDICTED: lysyl oxidase homolog 3 isoform X3 [Mandrillus leucophaeus]XP_025261644.1 lysyl oxidase homolog 3 isoform X2 [Theropithecus gelada]
MRPVSVWQWSPWGLLLCLLCSSCLGSPSPSTDPEKRAGSQGLRFRLAGFPRKPYEGRVEIQRAGEWGTICDDDFTLQAAHVLCRELGFTEATGWTHSAKYGPGTGRIWLDNLSCSGTEQSVTECASRGWGNSDCTHDEDAGVICKDQRLPGFSDSNVIEARVRLKGGAHPGEGRVEVLKASTWGTVCDRKWDLHAASVVCRELGFGSAREALSGARMGQGMGAIHLSEVRCSGQELSLWKCPHKNITAEDCSHSQDAGVRCNLPYTGAETRIRLSGGRSQHEGRVEVQIGGPGPLRWGLICGDDWGTLEAMVACRQLGLGYANHGLQETWYWDSGNITEVVMSGVRCTGTELSLDQCAHHGTHTTCKRTGTRFTAGVICSETASDLLLHSALVQETAYIEDRPLHMLYCAAEENCLASSARSANWPYGHRRLLRFSSQIHNLGRADFRPKAGRHSWVWHECHGHYHSMDIFTHYDILTPNGTKVAEGHKASFCLEDTECQEDVSKRYECANFGEQGITVGCWDLYRHDIDCQWIDITDVKPGNYILQVVINPNFEVAESDFTNNAMKCNCKYDGHRIWVHNCHIGDAFSEEANRRFERYPGQTSNQII